ncbi:hypothetical protein J14TS2_51670 [Bacillus sp. J14TS2]|nr:hypothetical protein J14TS2_51670 [Bacillus sp. J14TS2]
MKFNNKITIFRKADPFFVLDKFKKIIKTPLLNVTHLMVKKDEAETKVFSYKTKPNYY